MEIVVCVGQNLLFFFLVYKGFISVIELVYFLSYVKLDDGVLIFFFYMRCVIFIYLRYIFFLGFKKKINIDEFVQEWLVDVCFDEIIYCVFF